MFRSLSSQEEGKAMSIVFRIVIVLVCAYAGWQSASAQFAELPPSPQSDIASHQMLTK
jgi:hypothetical protein